ncbi:DUF3857 domain-containing protein [Bacteroides ihuae]|uniref:DUF3857 domain-containing protein n=1 Tax=Bacteroides ihuae TaxID=1852362 RepID=UPI0008D960ED|nr:DUF3857 domain-containing protein [Bacteroides ihuae]
MKKTTFLQVMAIAFLSFYFHTASYAQDLSTKFGKVTNDEVSMSTYDQDSTANAVVLYKKGRTYYDYLNNDFKIYYTIEEKIKILKSDGTSFANITIPYYENSRNTSKESITDIDAYSYNMENGKVVKTKMKKDYIFKERINDKYMQVKFSIPAVKAGTVIEYKYKMTSDFYYELKDWAMQEEIPVVYNDYDITIPEYFKFNLETRGGEKIETKDESSPVTFTVRGNNSQQMEMVHATARNLTFTGKNLPALKADSYIWCADDYKSMINFELLGIDFPGSIYHSFTSSWEKIDELLLKDEDFGDLLKLKNPFREEMKALPLSEMTTDQKIAAIFHFLKQKIAWNENYYLYGKSISKVVKSGSGSNADINFILMSMLRDADISSVPVVLSCRNRGILPYTHPSIQKLNTFVVGIQNTDSTKVFLDGSVSNGYINVLPPILMVDRARIVTSEKSGEKWCSLNHAGEGLVRSLVSASIAEDGTIKGERTTVYGGQYAATFRAKFKAAKDSANFISNMESEDAFKVLDYQQQGKEEFGPQIKEKITFTKQASVSDDHIYVNPMVFQHISKNPYIQESRKLPVEMSYPYTLRVSNSLKIPEGYEVEELPKQVLVSLEDGGGTCRYMVSVIENTILMTYLFSMDRTLFAPNEYPNLKTFWGTVADKNNEMIVLKKKTQL